MEWVLKKNKIEKYEMINPLLSSSIVVPDNYQDTPVRIKNWYIAGLVPALFKISEELGLDPEEFVDEYKDAFELTE